MSRSAQRHDDRSRLRLFAVGLATLAISGAGTGTASAAPCADAEAEANRMSDGAAAAATLCVLNAERRGHGLSRLRLSGPLSQAATAHSSDMVSRSYFSHTAPEGPGLLERVRQSGYLRSAPRWRLGENLAWGTQGRTSARAIVRAWMQSPRHRKVILTRAYREVGIGVVPGLPRPSANAGATYTADFAAKR